MTIYGKCVDASHKDAITWLFHVVNREPTRFRVETYETRVVQAFFWERDSDMTPTQIPVKAENIIDLTEEIICKQQSEFIDEKEFEFLVVLDAEPKDEKVPCINKN